MRTASRTVLAAVAAVLLVGTTAGVVVAQDEGGPSTAEMERGPAETCTPAAVPFDPEDIHLTGRWSTTDGAIYYVRQIGDTVWFSAMSDYQQREGEIGRDITSVGMGTLDGTTLSVEFADVPRGNVFNAGTLEVSVGADDAGDLQAVADSPDGESRQVFTPCQPEADEATDFLRPFTYTVPFGIASAHWPGSADLQVMSSPDVADISGISFWVVGPDWRATCSAPSLAIPPASDAASVESYLRAVPELAVGEGTEATLAGLPARVLDITTTPDATGCDGDEYVRMFDESGNVSGLGRGWTARLFLADLDGATFVAEVWGADPDAWWPIAQQIVDTVSFVPGASDGAAPEASHEAAEGAEVAEGGEPVASEEAAA